MLELERKVNKYLRASPRPNFVRETKAGFDTDWNMLVKDAELVNDFNAKGIAAILKERKSAK
jgi:hypothetical protein